MIWMNVTNLHIGKSGIIVIGLSVLGLVFWGGALITNNNKNNQKMNSLTF